MSIFWLMMACQSNHSTPPSPAEMELLIEDPEHRQEVLSQLPPEQRDLLLLQLAVHNPIVAPTLCGEVQGTVAKNKCTQVIGRPHLQLTDPQTVDGKKP